MTDLATRIERAYRATTGAPTKRGARAWFARLSHSHPTTVSRWLSGALAPPGPVIGLLEALEGRPQPNRPETDQ